MSPSTALIPSPLASERRAPFWRRLGRGLLVAGHFAGRGGRAAGRAAAWAYGAIDPDVRQHIAELPVVGLSMLMPHPRAVAPLPDDGFRPLVFVHGLGGRPGNFTALRAYAKLLGRRRVYVADLSKERSLSEMAQHLRDVVARVAEVNALEDGERVDLVAHSLGGIVARLALRDERVAARVATLVTMGSPHSGTHLARFAATSLTLELRPESPLLRELADQAREGGPRGVRAVAFWSRADVFMLPADTARLPGAENIELRGVTHYGYLMKPRCWRAVFDALDRD